MAATKINKTVAKIFTGLHGKIFKVSGGRFGGSFDGGELILLTTTGRKSGRRRERPLVGANHEGGWVIAASFSGHDEHPAWYLNLVADPTATVTTGAGEVAVMARETEGDERSELWDKMVSVYSDYSEYEKVTDRVIPVLVLEPVSSP